MLQAYNALGQRVRGYTDFEHKEPLLLRPPGLSLQSAVVLMVRFAITSASMAHSNHCAMLRSFAIAAGIQRAGAAGAQVHGLRGRRACVLGATRPALHLANRGDWTEGMQSHLVPAFGGFAASSKLTGKRAQARPLGAQVHIPTSQICTLQVSTCHVESDGGQPCELDERYVLYLVRHQGLRLCRPMAYALHCTECRRYQVLRT